MIDAKQSFFRLGTLFDKIKRLPSVPKLYAELMKLVDDPESTTEAIGKVIAKDMAMTAMILKTVNTAPFGLQRNVCNAAEATMYLGLNRVRTLALSLGVFSQFKAFHGGDGLFIETLWQHSIKVAARAQAIVKLEGLSDKKAEEAFCAGLLHDVGKLVLADNFAGPFQLALMIAKREAEKSFKAEELVFGANHADVGGGLLLNWKLPLPIGMAVYLHHAPSRAGRRPFGVLTAVHVADAIEDGLEGRQGVPEKLLDVEHLEQLGLMDRLPAWRQVTPSAIG